ncbi:polymorphic outer membrane protein repeat-containing protein [Parelusimicrobium proximum]|uniref:autotransporter family protein n=1 Tax=Parelusimicrobium proximum TaxID=3228953 RepID=UPI003D181493
MSTEKHFWIGGNLSVKVFLCALIISVPICANAQSVNSASGLSAAFSSANSSVTIEQDAVISLTGAMPNPTIAKSITGNSAVIDGGGNYRFFTTGSSAGFGSMSDITIQNMNDTAANGSAGYVNGSVAGGFNNVTIQGNTARVSAFYVSGNFSGGVSNSVFENNDATASWGSGGAALGVYGSFFGDIDSSQFTNNIATGNFGGAVSIRGAMTGDIRDAAFTNNKVSSPTQSVYGGGIGISGIMTGGIYGSAFIGNRAESPTGSGGGFKANAISDGIHDSLFQDNYAQSLGGGVQIAHSGAGSAVLSGGINNSRFINNESGSQGGAIAMTATTVTATISGGINNSLFEENSSAQAGGAIIVGYIDRIYKTDFISNVTGLQGGGVLASVNLGDIDESNFTSNISGQHGGAVITWGSMGDIDNSHFTSNEAATGSGGALVAYQKINSITSSTFSSNKAGLNGGAVWANTGIPLIENTTFYNNSAKGYAGAVLTPSGLGTIKDSLFDKNSVTASSAMAGAGLGGAGVFGGSYTIQDSVFTNNSASTENTADPTGGRGGAIFHMAAGTPSTITLNKTAAGGDFIFLGNTQNISGAGETYNSIYIGSTSLYTTAPSATVNLNIATEAGTSIYMYDPMASQPDDMASAAGDLTDVILHVNKAGQGTWVLAGHNDMKAAGDWTISEGELHLIAKTPDGRDGGAHIDLSHTDSSFTLKSGAALSACLTDTPHQITAQNIILESGSTITLKANHGESFVTWSSVPDSPLKVLSLNPGDSVSFSNAQDAQQAPGQLRVGLNDYDYTLDWDDIQATDLFLNINAASAVFNDERAGIEALSAPALVAYRNPIDDEIARRVQLRKDCTEADQCGNLWITPYFDLLNQKSGSGRANFDFYIPGNIVGYDHIVDYFNNEFLAGIAASGAFPQYRSSNADVKGMDFGALVYAGFNTKEYLNLLFFLGYNHIESDMKRHVHGHGYKSDYNTDMFRAGAEASVEIGLGERFMLRPFAMYEYYYMHTGGFREGDGAYSLSAESFSQNLSKIKLGSDLIVYKNNFVNFSAQAYYTHLFDEINGETDIYFIQDPSTVYTVETTPLDRNVFGGGVSGGISLSPAVRLNGSYAIESGKTTLGHQLTANISIAI